MLSDLQSFRETNFSADFNSDFFSVQREKNVNNVNVVAKVGEIPRTTSTSR